MFVGMGQVESSNITELVGYGSDEKDALMSLNACMVFYHNMEIPYDSSGYYVIDKSGRKWYVFYAKENGKYRCRFKLIE